MLSIIKVSIIDFLKHGDTRAHAAASIGDTELLAALIAAGADVNMQNNVVLHIYHIFTLHRPVYYITYSK